MSEMLFNSSTLSSLDLSIFNTNNVTNMNAMFYNNSSFENEIYLTLILVKLKKWLKCFQNVLL